MKLDSFFRPLGSGVDTSQIVFNGGPGKAHWCPPDRQFIATLASMRVQAGAV
jgi:hypothetical protein